MRHAAAIAAAAAVAAAAPCGTAAAARAQPPGAYRVTVATHRSSSEKAQDSYAGRSSATWRLAPPRRGAPNRLYVNRFGGSVSATATVAVTGAFTFTAHRDGGAACGFTARTGSREHALQAPRTVALSLVPDPGDRRRLRATFTGVLATLGGPYVPAECATGTRGEPDADVVAMRSVPASVLRRGRFELRFAGSRVADGITYRWATTFRLVRSKST